MAGPLKMLIQLPDIMQWCGVTSVLASTATYFILIWRILQASWGKTEPLEKRNETVATLQTGSDYHYCRVTTSEPDKDNVPATSETSSLNP